MTRTHGPARAGVALVRGQDAAEATRLAASAALAATGFDRAAMAIVLLTPDFATEAHAAAQAAREALGTSAFVGASTSALLARGPGASFDLADDERAVAVLAIGGAQVWAEAALLPDAHSSDLGRAIGLLTQEDAGLGQRPRSVGHGLLFAPALGFHPERFAEALTAQAPGFGLAGAVISGGEAGAVCLGAGKSGAQRSALCYLRRGLTLGDARAGSPIASLFLLGEGAPATLRGRAEALFSSGIGGDVPALGLACTHTVLVGGARPATILGGDQAGVIGLFAHEG